MKSEFDILVDDLMAVLAATATGDATKVSEEPSTPYMRDEDDDYEDDEDDDDEEDDDEDDDDDDEEDEDDDDEED